jgi:hypothetical protein
MKKIYRESTGIAKVKSLICTGIFHDADVSTYSVKRFQTVKKNCSEVHPRFDDGSFIIPPPQKTNKSFA